jgi:hypothetical protein
MDIYSSSLVSAGSGLNRFPALETVQFQAFHCQVTVFMRQVLALQDYDHTSSMLIVLQTLSESKNYVK